MVQEPNTGLRSIFLEWDSVAIDDVDNIVSDGAWDK